MGQKWELKDEHEASWRVNGLHDLNYDIISSSFLNKVTVKYTIELALNNHWTDKVSNINLERNNIDATANNTDGNKNRAQDYNDKNNSSKDQDIKTVAIDTTAKSKRKLDGTEIDVAVQSNSNYNS